MGAPLVTVEAFRARRDAQWLGSLTSDDESGGTVDDGTVALALEDATAEIEAYVARLPASHHPPASTQRVHCCKVATYLLTLDRPGKEFEQIRNAYLDVIKFYTDAIASAEAAGSAPPSLEGSACIPPPVFTRKGAWQGML